MSIFVMQGATKRQGYFPKGKWYDLFDNSTIDAHDGGKSVTLDLPMGQVGVHAMGGTILPMQQAALVTADVQASPLTLVVALPHLQPLAQTHSTDRSQLQDKHMPDQSSSAPEHSTDAQQLSGTTQNSRRLMASMAAQPSMIQNGDGPGVTAATECGVSDPGRVTACGQLYLDSGDHIQV